MKAYNTGPTSTSISWEPVRVNLQNGIIIGYTITYQSLTDSGVVQVGPNDRQTNITGLEEFVEYNISVFASTVKGNGTPFFLIVKTDQDSKCPI